MYEAGAVPRISSDCLLTQRKYVTNVAYAECRALEWIRTHVAQQRSVETGVDEMGEKLRGDTDAGTTVESFIPLRSVEVDILIALSGEPVHGYAILKEAEARHGGHPGFEIPTLYRALRRMREAGLVRSLRDHGDDTEDQRRQYWQATPLGGRVLEAEIARLEAVVEAGRRVAGGGASA